jgi:iduronate 2-sulfatase
MIAVPGLKPARTGHLIELVDLYPTLCDLVGFGAPAHLEGESMVESLRHPRSQHDDVAFSQYARFGERYMGRAVRTANFRYVAWFDNRTDAIVEEELYDHRNDPAESKNLANDSSYSALRIDLQQRILRSLP